MPLTPARCAFAALAIFLACQAIGAQSYSRGQNVSPAYEGWDENPDGSFSFLFGYMNRNWEEEIDVPVGPDNDLEPGGPDQGQPTHFLPRRNRFVFRVRVPKGFTEKDEMIWTLTTKGKTERAYGTLRLDYKVDDVVRASETGALGAGTSSPEVRANRAPIVKIEGDGRRSVTVGQPLSLVTHVADDGVPRPRGRSGQRTGGAPADPGNPVPQVPGPGRSLAYVPPSRITVGKALGLHLSWFVYRGAGKVTFEPVQIKVWEDTRAGARSPWAPLWTPPPLPPDGNWAVQVTFAEPGTYVLRARADDGALYADEDVTVTVTERR